MSITVEIAKIFRFEAAHFLPNVSENHQCRGIHGHSYRVTLMLRGPIIEPTGWVMDLCDLSRAFDPWLKMLDHSFLNNIEGLENPTSENLAIWLMRRVGRALPELSSVTVSSTGRISVTVRRQDMDL